MWNGIWDKQRLEPESATAYLAMIYVCARDRVPRFRCFRCLEGGGLAQPLVSGLKGRFYPAHAESLGLGKQEKNRPRKGRS
jgi:hypothetical protein